MIKGKPKFAGLEGDALTAARLDDLDARLYQWEMAQHAAWTWTAAEKGETLERKLAALQESLADLSGIVSGLDDTVLDETRLAATEAQLADLTAQIADLQRQGNNLLNMVEAVAKAAGYQPWAGTAESWPQWYEYLTGHKPD